MSISMSCPHRSSRWSQLKTHFGKSQRRAHLRHELMNLSDRTLRDIGVARCDAGIQGPKLFLGAIIEYSRARGTVVGSTTDLILSGYLPGLGQRLGRRQ
jgi:uncharacterized protein YjiS (DUF1127 family)